MDSVTVLTPCFNEEDNVRAVYERVREEMDAVPDCEYEHLFIDNASGDRTVEILRELAAADPRVKVAGAAVGHTGLVASHAIPDDARLEALDSAPELGTTLGRRLLLTLGVREGGWSRLELDIHSLGCSRHERERLSGQRP